MTATIGHPPPPSERARRPPGAGDLPPPGRPSARLATATGGGPCPAIVMVLAIHYIATAGGAFYAFTDWTGIGDFNFIGLDNFVRIFEDPALIGSLKNTLFLAFGFLILTNVLGLVLALALNRTLKTRYLLRVAAVHAGRAQPAGRLLHLEVHLRLQRPAQRRPRLVRHGALQRTWLADPTLALWAILVVMAWQTTGMCMVIYLAGLATVPPEIEEAAAIDGAGTWSRFRHITVPVDPPVHRDRRDPHAHPGPARLRPGHGAHRRRARPAPPRPWPRRSTRRPSRSATSASAPRSRSADRHHPRLLGAPAAGHQRPLVRGRRRRCSATRRPPRSARCVVWIVALLSLLPFYFLVSTALKPDEELLTTSSSAPPSRPTVENFAEVLTGGRREQHPARPDEQRRSSPLGSIVGLVIFGSLAAYVLARTTQRWGTSRSTCSSSRSSCPTQLGLIPLYIGARTLGLVGTPWGMIVLYVGTLMPLAVFLYAGFFRGLPRDYEEAAAIDGASPGRVFSRVVLPLMAPATGTVAILTGLIVWNDFFTALIFLGGSDYQTLTVSMYYYVGSLVSAWNKIFAIVIISMVPILAFYLFAQKKFIQGFAGGIK